MSQQLKEVLTYSGISQEQVEKLEAGEIKPADLVPSIEEFYFDRFKNDPAKVKTIIDPVIADREKKYIQKIKNQLNLTDEEIQNRDLLDSLDMGIKKRGSELLAEYQNTNDAELVNKNAKLREEVVTLRREYDDYKMNYAPNLQKEFDTKLRAEKVKLRTSEWIKDTFQFTNTPPKMALLYLEDSLKSDGYYVDFDSNESKLVLLSKETNTAPLADVTSGSGVVLLEQYAKQLYGSNKLLKQSNAEETSTTPYREETTPSRQTKTSIQTPNSGRGVVLQGADRIRKAQETDKLYNKNVAIA